MTERPEWKFEVAARDMTDAELGALLREYIAESNHGGWDGFGRHHMSGIRAFLTDVLIYQQNKIEYNK
jgi:hypothetical protein